MVADSDLSDEVVSALETLESTSDDSNVAGILDVGETELSLLVSSISEDRRRDHFLSYRDQLVNGS